MNQVRCNLVVIRSAQLDASVRFYEALGLRLTKHRHGTGPEHYASEDETQTFEIYPLTNESTAITGIRIGFAVESVDQVFERLLGVGGRAVSSPKDSPWGRRAVISDPDGHRVEYWFTELESFSIRCSAVFQKKLANDIWVNFAESKDPYSHNGLTQDSMGGRFGIVGPHGRI